MLRLVAYLQGSSIEGLRLLIALLDYYMAWLDRRLVEGLVVLGDWDMLRRGYESS